MAFLNPLVLIGLMAAAVPLLVHFFNFRQPQRLDFSSLSLLHALKKTTIQRMRIRQWLLLLLRTLAICALVAAFAQPVLTGATGGQFMGRANLSMAIVLDNSLSMAQSDAGGSYLEQIRASALALIQDLQPADEVFIWASSTHEPLQIDDLARLEPSAVTATTSEAIDRAAQHLLDIGGHADRLVLFLGDLQESTLADSLSSSLPTDIAVRVISVHAPDRPNVAVIGAVVDSRIVELGEPVRIEATVVNHGTTPVEDWAISLYLEDERVAQSGVSLPPGVPTTVILSASPQTYGWLTGYIESEDDDFYQDNRHYFTLQVPRQRDILIVAGPGAQTSPLELALTLREDQNPFQPLVIDAAALPTTPLAQFDAVFLVGPASLASGEIAELTRYVEQGGGLMIFPSDDLVASNALLDAVDAGNWQILESTQTVTDAEFEHTVFEGVFEGIPSGRDRRIEPVQVYRMAAYTPGNAVEQPLIRLSGGSPFLQEIRYGLGHMLLMAVAPDYSWSDLPVRGLFIPLLYRAAHYLSAGESVQGDHLFTGQPATVRMRATGNMAHLITPAGVEVVPDQRQLFGTTILDVQVDEPGVADIVADGQLLRRLSISLDARESRLTYTPLNEAAGILTAALGVPVDMPDDVFLDTMPETVMQARLGVGLWRHCLIAALMLLAAEMIVAMRWREDRS